MARRSTLGRLVPVAPGVVVAPVAPAPKPVDPVVPPDAPKECMPLVPPDVPMVSNCEVPLAPASAAALTPPTFPVPELTFTPSTSVCRSGGYPWLPTSVMI